MTERWHRLSSECRHSAVDGGSVVVHETGNDGRAEVRIAAPEGWHLEKVDG
jgi:hypothetical protein